MSKKYQIIHEPPSVDDFVHLRQAIGWGDTDAELAEKSMDNSLFHVSIYDKGILIGIGRVVGDGYMYFYVQDVVVEPKYQGNGIGALLMNEIESYLKKNARAGATVGLLAAKGKEGFYLKYGYLERSGDSLGKGMCKFV